MDYGNVDIVEKSKLRKKPDHPLFNLPFQVLLSCGYTCTCFILPLFMHIHVHDCALPYSQKIWWFGSMPFNRQIKIRQMFFFPHMHVCMAITYHSAKFKSTNSVKTSLGAKLPNNLMTANISGYTVYVQSVHICRLNLHFW